MTFPTTTKNWKKSCRKSSTLSIARFCACCSTMPTCPPPRSRRRSNCRNRPAGGGVWIAGGRQKRCGAQGQKNGGEFRGGGCRLSAGAGVLHHGRRLGL